MSNGRALTSVCSTKDTAYGSVLGQYLSEGVTLLRSALGLAGWVAEREDDWALVERGHVSDDLLGEGSGHCSHSCKETKQRRTTQVFCEDDVPISKVHIFPTEKEMDGG